MAEMLVLIRKIQLDIDYKNLIEKYWQIKKAGYNTSMNWVTELQKYRKRYA